MSGVDEHVLVEPPLPKVAADQPVPWYRGFRVTVAILVVGIVLIVVGSVALLGSSSANTDADAFATDADAATARHAELQNEITSENAVLVDAIQELKEVEGRLAALEAETTELQATRDAVVRQSEDAASWLANVEADAAALQVSSNDLFTAIDAAIAADLLVNEELLAAVEAGNRRDLASMNAHLESSRAALEDLRVALDEQDSVLGSFQAMAPEVQGTTASGVLATESFDDADSGWTETDSPDGATAYLDGSYQIVAATDATVIGLMPISISDIAVEVDATVVDAPDGADFEYGIICRDKETSMSTEGYLASVGPAHVRIGAFDERGVYEELAPWNEVQQPTAEPRRLVAVCDGDRIGLRVDGEPVAEATGIGLRGTSVGLFAVSYSGDPITIRFDNMRLVHPSVVGGSDAS